MSTLTYGPAPGSSARTIEICRTNSVKHEAIYDDSGTDYEVTKITFDVSGLITFLSTGAQDASGFSGPIGPGLIGENNVTQIMQGVRRDLMQPRLPLTFQIGSQVPAYLAITTTPDARNGPRPISCNIRRIDGSQVLWVDYIVECHVVGCNVSPSAGNLGIRSHRWSESLSLSEDGMQTWTREGRITCRSDILQDASQLQGMVAIGIRPGYKRTKAEYRLQKDGLALDYTFEDTEQYIVPPSGVMATKATGSYAETGSKFGVIRYGEAKCSLTAAKEQPKAALMFQAIAICVNKLCGQNGGFYNGNGGDFAKQGKPLFLGAELHEELYENSVACSIKVQFPQPRQTVKGIPFAAGQPLLNIIGGIPLGSEDGNAININNRVVTNLGLMVAAFSDPCLGVTVKSLVNGATPTQASEDPEGDGDIPADVSMFDSLPDDGTTDVNDEQDAIWQDYQLQIHSNLDNHVVQLPLAGSTTSQSLGDPGSISQTAGQTQSCAIVQLANQTMRKSVVWSCQAAGGVMSIPNPIPQSGSNWVFRRGEIVSRELKMSADGQNVGTTISGRYDYFVKDPSQEKVQFPIPPFIMDSIGTEVAQSILSFDTDNVIVNEQNGVSIPSQ